MSYVLGLAGDTMLGRGVAERLARVPPEALFSPDVVALCRSADLFVLNLECCISERGARWSDPSKPFFFRAPPSAVDALVLLGVDCVTLANNHALDYGAEALVDTFELLRAAGIAWAGAGPDLDRARAPVVLTAAGERVTVASVTDHPPEFAARQNAPGVAYADLRRGTPSWLLDALRDGETVVVSPHWGPNMTSAPVPWVRACARTLMEAGASLVAGHSAHVFHGVWRRVLFDLGDFIDDYAVDRALRNDLGLLFLVTMDCGLPRRVEAWPLALDYCHTRLATGDDARWVHERFGAACSELGTRAESRQGRLIVEFPAGACP